MCALALPKGVIKQIDKARRHCLWRGSDINSKKPPKAAWELVCRRKEEGGLGVLDLKRQNEALLMKNLDKFYNKKDIPWVTLVWEKHYHSGKLPNHTVKGSFWWRDILKLVEEYKKIACVQVMDGLSCFLWSDKWNNDPFLVQMPELYSFAKKII